MYDVFGFSFKLNLSTRPEKYLGDIEVWNQAEKVNSSFINFSYESKAAAGSPVRTYCFLGGTVTAGHEQYNFNNCLQFSLAAVDSLVSIWKQSPCQNQIISLLSLLVFF